MNFKSIFAGAAAVAGALALFTGCGESADNNTLVLATEATFPPYEFRSAGQIVGVDIDICQAVADKLGKKLDIQDTAFDSVITHVVTGKADIAASGITITEDRKKNVLFSDPYVSAAQLIMVLKDSKIKGVDDLKGKRLGAQAGTTGLAYIREKIITEKNSPLVAEFPNGGLAVEAMKAGKGARLPKWSEDVVIRAQYPDEHSKMTAPYLYVESRFGRVPWKETMIELFSEDWEIVE